MRKVYIQHKLLLELVPMRKHNNNHLICNVQKYIFFYINTEEETLLLLL